MREKSFRHVPRRSKRASRMFGGCLLAAVLTAMCGCGGSSADDASARWGGMSKEEWLAQREKKLQQERTEESAAARAAKAPPPPLLATRSKRVGRESDDDDAPSAASRPKKSTRPQNVGDWKPQDFFSAQHDGDPRLTAAVQHLGNHSTDEPAAAELIAKLLESSEANAASRGIEPNPRLAETAVAALSANSAPQARQTLERLVAGTLPAANPQAAATAAFKAMLARDCPENDDLLFRVITVPDRPNQASRTEVDPQKLRYTAISFMRTAGSESLRVRLAQQMLAPETSATLYNQLWACLREARPENAAAQITLYQSLRLDQKSQDLLEQRLADQSGEVLTRLLGIPSSKRGSASNAKSDATTDPYHLAEMIWSPDFAASVERRLRLIDSLGRETRLVVLASAIPNPSLRSALLRVLQRHWDEGPKGLEPFCKPEGVTVEPGFVVLTKTLLRKDDLGAGADKTARGSGVRPSGFAVKAARSSEMRQLKQLQEAIAQRWVDLSRNVVCATCRQFRQAAQADLNSDARNRTAADVQIPVKPYPGAEVASVYRLEWPAGLSGKVAAAPSLQVVCIRLEIKASPVRLLAHYRRQLPDCVEREIPAGRWLDSLVQDDQGRVRSIDVLLAKASRNALGLPDQEQELTADILVIECESFAKKNPVSASR